MRLIDADKLKREDLCDFCNSADCANCFADKAFEQWIANQPTAYDPYKVVEQLGEKFLAEKNFRAKGCRLDAIEIVKGGAV